MSRKPEGVTLTLFIWLAHDHTQSGLQSIRLQEAGFTWVKVYQHQSGGECNLESSEGSICISAPDEHSVFPQQDHDGAHDV